MIPLCLGKDERNNFAPVRLDRRAFSRHIHLVGRTGTGKTTAVHTLLRPLMMEPGRERCSLFVIDPMGGLSHDLLLWMASSRCPDHVRRRLLYVEPARDEFVLPFNPLHAAVGDARYYHVARAVDLILRAWKAQDLSLQPRLMQWSYKALAGLAALGLPIAMSRFLLHPGSPEHQAIVDRIPGEIASHWQAILNARGQEATRILESTRNRFDPIYEAPQTRRMFGLSENFFDVESLIRERRIVIVNVARQGRISGQLGSTIGALIANEVFETAATMSARYGRNSVDPTYLLLDEFQKFVGPDIEDAIPTVRQMGLRLILAHQSFSQLEQGDIDLSNMIWQAQNRLMFANAAEDANLIAEELAKVTFDPMAIKDRRLSLKQLISGYRTEWLESEGHTQTRSDSRSQQSSVGYGRSGSESHRSDAASTRVVSKGDTQKQTDATGTTYADSSSDSRGRHQSLVPIHDTIEEVSSVTYQSFEEHRLHWDRIIRQLRTGVAFGQFVDDDHLYKIHVDYHPVRVTARLRDRVEELLQRNFEQDCFISREEADRREELVRQQLLTAPRIILRTESHSDSGTASPSAADPDCGPSPFNNPARDA